MRAFVRSLEVIGEAVKKIPSDFKEKHTEIPWKEIAGMRDKLIHEYFGVNYKIVWKTVQLEIPRLMEKIENILKERGELEPSQAGTGHIMSSGDILRVESR